MKQEIDRVKDDVETIQKAMGLFPAMAQEWVQWMKRDKWLNLWWFLPGLILVASAFLPFPSKEKYLGLVPDQWTGLLVSAAVLGVFTFHMQKTTAKDGRPESLIREYKRYWGVDSHGLWVCSAMVLQLFIYFFWALHFRLSTVAFISGLFMIMGSTYLVVAIVSKVWLLLGWAIPLLGYGLFVAFLSDNPKIGAIPLGIMFIATALFCSILQSWQIRKIERQNEAH